jgi:hypothetical protein
MMIVMKAHFNEPVKVYWGDRPDLSCLCCLGVDLTFSLQGQCPPLANSFYLIYVLF